MIIDEDVYLEHHGVKGMKWGVRKNRNSTPKQPWSTKKKVGVGLGVAAVVAGTAAAIFISKNGNLPFSSISKPSAESKKLVEDLGKKVVQGNPTSVLHASRAKNTGFKVLKDGSTMSPLSAVSKVFGEEDPKVGTFKRTADGLVGVVFNDPQGRTDRAGRVIPHMVVIPKEHAIRVGTYDAAVRKAWSLVKDSYEDHWQSG